MAKISGWYGRPAERRARVLVRDEEEETRLEVARAGRPEDRLLERLDGVHVHGTVGEGPDAPASQDRLPQVHVASSAPSRWSPSVPPHAVPVESKPGSAALLGGPSGASYDDPSGAPFPGPGSRETTPMPDAPVAHEERVKQVLLGDEAVALAALDAGITAAYAYPGTPSTEILEYLVRHEQRHGGPKAVWSRQREDGLRAGARRLHAGPPRPGLHEARRPQRGRRPVRQLGPRGRPGRASWSPWPTTPACTARRTSRTAGSSPTSPGCSASSPRTSRRPTT